MFSAFFSRDACYILHDAGNGEKRWLSHVVTIQMQDTESREDSHYEMIISQHDKAILHGADTVIILLYKLGAPLKTPTH